uniref:Protein kinase domain-containing protein n=1 Tax=Chromera velia CCMP2878 TaxID=1169474 RepID=A0A0G4GAW7_9ALVE|eukprot:Cvel_21080.t1-p1 / transcript=Cvel_21080.t1 / gene=Cvel_21080 / organism=Chromera_velia_CCMP2878 / gene_product=hypothetical protein / transcript_product=hypothetical protein / location=Cvel_scaffold1948:26899-28972(-) / protein_length=484 / sequence_SO=supercontig / SO=protein_coding / is_pseudo=false
MMRIAHLCFIVLVFLQPDFSSGLSRFRDQPRVHDRAVSLRPSLLDEGQRQLTREESSDETPKAADAGGKEREKPAAAAGTEEANNLTPPAVVGNGSFKTFRNCRTHPDFPFPDSLLTRFSDVCFIARGQNGAIFSAHDSKLNGPVAVKIFFQKRKTDDPPSPAPPRFITKATRDENYIVLAREKRICRISSQLVRRREEDPLGFTRLGLCREMDTMADPPFDVMTMAGTLSLRRWVHQGRPSIGENPGGAEAVREMYKQMKQAVTYLEETDPPIYHNEAKLGHWIYTVIQKKGGGSGIGIRLVDWSKMTANKPAKFLASPDRRAIVWAYCELLCPAKGDRGDHSLEDPHSGFWFYWWKHQIKAAKTPLDILKLFATSDVTGPEGTPAGKCPVCRKRNSKLCDVNEINLQDATTIFQDGSDSSHGAEGETKKWGLTRWLLWIVGGIAGAALMLALGYVLIVWMWEPGASSTGAGSRRESKETEAS